MIRRAKLNKTIRGVYRFLPLQLLLLHFRKYQLLLLFWLILFATVTGHFASVFGASTLFLTPEYLGEINFVSMMLLGGAMAVFVMAWHITTFIIHSHRIPFIGATRQAFLKYCLNNSILPLVFLIFYSVVSIRFQWFNEHADVTKIIRFQVSFYLGLFLIIFISFAYFFRVDRDLLKVVLSRITNPFRIKEIIPHDSLDHEVDIIHADTYLSGRFRIKRCCDLDPYHPRLLHAVLRKHHRNAITATLFAFFVLLLLGIFMDEPKLRIPAGAGFLILFSIIMGIAGAMKYFLRTWQIFGWVLIAGFLGWLVHERVFDLRSIAYGMDYNHSWKSKPEYNYDELKKLFTPAKYDEDKRREEHRLGLWKSKKVTVSDTAAPLVVISISGGGSRAAFWTFRALQYADSVTGGKLFNNTVLITGASGGMIGAAYWRELHKNYAEGRLKDPYNSYYQENIGKDVLNAIIFSFAAVDMISPFNKMSIAGYSYSKDRGFAMEQELIRNTEGLLDRKIGDYQQKEATADIPLMIINSTVINDGRKLMVSSQPISYLTQPEYALKDSVHPPIDAIDFAAFYKNQNPLNLRLTTALRMNATFPYILPVVKLPSRPSMNVMDAGLRDNFGIELASRYIYTMRNWIESNGKDVVLLEIRDTREHEVFPSTDMSSLGSMLSDPLFIIQQKWEPFQSYTHGYMKDYLNFFVKSKLHFLSLQYIPEERNKAAALNFHLTSKEKRDILYSMKKEENLRVIDTLAKLMSPQTNSGLFLPVRD